MPQTKERSRTFEFLLQGNQALFTDPLTGLGGENASLPFPTYEALVGICESIYWKPTLKWVVEVVRVLKPIRFYVQGVKTRSFANEDTGMHGYSYLWDVAYEVQAHFVWNDQRPDLAQDRDLKKHEHIAERAIKLGGRRDVFLGTRECQAYVEPVQFGLSEGYYDDTGCQQFGLTYHGIDYPKTRHDDALIRFWYPAMADGVIDFLAPDKCPVRRVCKSKLTDFYQPSVKEAA